MKLTTVDLKILNIIQKHSDLSQIEQAELAGMSRSSFWRHVKDMEEAGVINMHGAEIDAKAVGFSIRANCVISINNHSSETREKFENHILNLDNVIECYATSGGKDYMLTVVAKDIENYYELMSSSILDSPTIDSSYTSFLMKKIKSTTVLPLH